MKIPPPQTFLSLCLATAPLNAKATTPSLVQNPSSCSALTPCTLSVNWDQIVAPWTQKANELQQYARGRNYIVVSDVDDLLPASIVATYTKIRTILTERDVGSRAPHNGLWIRHLRPTIDLACTPQDRSHKDATKLYLSFQDVVSTSQTLAKNIKDAGMPSTLVAVTRGGLFPTYVVAKTLGLSIDHIETFCAESYKGIGIQGGMTIHHAPNPGRIKDAIFIDDLLDTGGTICEIQKTFPTARIGVVYIKNNPDRLQKFAATMGQQTFDAQQLKLSHGTMAENKWIVFPWELD